MDDKAEAWADEQRLSSNNSQTSPGKAEELGPATTMGQKVNAAGILLIPQPSDDPDDPLNWSTFKKVTTLSIVCCAAFLCLLQALANSAGYFPQAALYHKSTVQVSYSISAAIAGMCVGPLIWAPLATRFGKSGVLFWCLVFTLLSNVWSALMTKPTQYIPFVISRLLAGLFGSSALTIGSIFIVETFFLHDRGKCFAAYTVSFLLGGICCQTFSGYIVQSASWTVQFWYNVALEGALVVMMFLFLDDTMYSRPGDEPVPRAPRGYVQRKMATYFFTKRLTPYKSGKELARLAAIPFVIGASPISVIIGLVMMTCYAFSIAINTSLSIFLQTPVPFGGYGFTPSRNASFTFVLWASAVAAGLYGGFAGDRLSLAICARRGGLWKPEYRLHALWFPLFFCFPLGLGLFGGSLYYHWHYMVLALGTFLTSFGAVCSVPPTLNYLIEAFSPDLANEVSSSVNVYRLSLAIALTFFIFPWIDHVGVNWVFGMMAFFSIFCFVGVLAALLWGPQIRAKSFIKLEAKEEIYILNNERKPEMPKV